MKNKLADPRKSYLAEGGEIFIAVDNTTGKSAGVCALLHQAEQDRWELAKLSVDPASIAVSASAENWRTPSSNWPGRKARSGCIWNPTGFWKPP